MAAEFDDDQEDKLPEKDDIEDEDYNERAKSFRETAVSMHKKSSQIQENRLEEMRSLLSIFTIFDDDLSNRICFDELKSHIIPYIDTNKKNGKKYTEGELDEMLKDKIK